MFAPHEIAFGTLTSLGKTPKTLDGKYGERAISYKRILLYP